MTELKCPFCQQEMVIPKEEVRKGIQCCVCRNPKCEFDGWHFPVRIITALINEIQHATDCQDLFIEAIAQKLEIEKYLADTKKKLDIAMDLLEIMNDGLPNGNRWKWEIEKALEQINQKEQQ